MYCYNVEEGERINAWLLLPKQLKTNNPAIIASHQHAGEYYLGKSEPVGLSSNTMYHYGLDLCLRGYVVLCPDHLCFEDRRPPEFKRAGQKMELINDHDPKPLHYQFLAEMPDKFEWEYLENGPEVWRVSITKK